MFSSINTCWVLVAAFLVYFMQAGFALYEAGFTRAKNTGNILMKNMMDFCIGTPCYWVIGFGLMFGGTSALIGGFDPFIQGDYSHLGLDVPLWVYIVFQTVFCATAATIVSGSMAERTNFKAYCVYSAAVATCVTMIFTWLRYGKPDVSMTLNGSLAGLVAITAGCDAVSPFGAFIIGFVAGILVVLSVEFFDKIARIDDPVGAVSVHFANGVWGTIAVGLFSNGGDGVGKGLFYGGGFAQLGTQLPKIKVEVIVSKISVDAVVDAAKKALYTGHIGDGKIFVYNVTRVVKIRTGEEDFAALQDVE